MGRYLLEPYVPNSKVVKFRPRGRKGITQVCAYDLDEFPDPGTDQTIEVGARFRTTFYRVWRIISVEPHEVVAVSETSKELAFLSPAVAAQRFTEDKRIRQR